MLYLNTFYILSNPSAFMVTIKIDQSDEFFIAIAKQEGHSFVFAGIKQKGKIHLLARVGKVFKPQKGKCLIPKALCNAVFFQAQAQIEDEGIARPDGWESSISYAAHAISYQQYLQFVALLEEIETEDSFECYKPGEEGELEFTGKKVLASKSDEKNACATKIIARGQVLNLSNTCRHTAIDLIKYVCNDEQVTHDISRTFFCNLPLETFLVANDGKPFLLGDDDQAYCLVHPDPELPFYILPPPPTSFKNLPAFQRRVLNDLYRRMEEMLRIAPNSPDTQTKFELLKTLYNEKSGPCMVGFATFISDIANWHERHQKEINTLRETNLVDCFFTRKSTTQKMCEQWFSEEFKLSFSH
ncbi:Uncharacterised protein [Legionella lansingensis]|uniref:Uncharacterized protein n=1 Tax=Legionella lansingensis TaxID=45067 RepID=A0A0W0VUR0_9GAMM|nr:hypothetical protein [Legionella lansingensis]KTD23802.1 hypothetical protein Llan_0583 [Legionella lansingensis]SNV46970.1 Uncharacterised protein [Legionella lansingensis]